MYYFVLGPKTYAEAKAFCISLGRKLFEPKSPQVNVEVTELVQNEGVSNFWVGIHDIANEGDFVYDSNGQIINYQNWNSGEPNSAGEEDCTEIYVSYNIYVENGKWNDVPCNNQLSFVCEKSGKVDHAALAVIVNE